MACAPLIVVVMGSNIVRSVSGGGERHTANKSENGTDFEYPRRGENPELITDLGLAGSTLFHGSSIAPLRHPLGI